MTKRSGPAAADSISVHSVVSENSIVKMIVMEPPPKGKLKKQLKNDGDGAADKAGVGWRHKPLTVLTATLFVAGENAGGALLALPFAMANCGWFGLLMVALLGLNAAYAGQCLAQAWVIVENSCPEYRAGHRYPYPAIGLQAFGPKMRFFVSIIMHVTLCGASVVLLLLCSEIIFSLTAVHTDISFCAWILILASILCPLMWFGTPGEFWPAAAGAIGTTAVASALIIWQMLGQLLSSDFRPPISAQPTFSSFFLGIGTVMFAYGGTPGFPTFQNDMQDRSRFRDAVAYGFTILIVLYMPMSTVGYLTFGGVAHNDVFMSLTPSTTKFLAQLLMASHLFFAFLLVSNAPAQELEHLLGVPKALNWHRIVLRTSFLIVIVFVAESLPKFGKLLNLIGGSSMATLTYVMPVVFYWKLKAEDHATGRMSIKERLFLVQIVAVGVFGGVACTYSALLDLFAPEAFTRPCYLNFRFRP